METFDTLGNLKENREHLIEYLRFEGSFLIKLVTHKVITDPQRDVLQAVATRRERTQKLVEMVLLGVTEERVQKLVHVLEATDQKHLANVVLLNGKHAVSIWSLNASVFLLSLKTYWICSIIKPNLK